MLQFFMFKNDEDHRFLYLLSSLLVGLLVLLSFILLSIKNHVVSIENQIDSWEVIYEN